MLNERTADVAEELSKEKERNACVFNDLRDCQEKLNIAESQLTTISRELQLVSSVVSLQVILFQLLFYL